MIAAGRELGCCATPDVSLQWHGTPQPLVLPAGPHILNARLTGDWPCVNGDEHVTVVRCCTSLTPFNTPEGGPERAQCQLNAHS